jgi:hypothetical protein
MVSNARSRTLNLYAGTHPRLEVRVVGETSVQLRTASLVTVGIGLCAAIAQQVPLPIMSSAIHPRASLPAMPDRLRPPPTWSTVVTRRTP